MIEIDMDVKLFDKNGNLLRGAAKQAVLNKLAKVSCSPTTDEPTTDEMIFLMTFSDRLEKVERRLKYLPISVIFALVVGCAAGKFLKPDFVAILIGGGAAGSALAVVNQKQGWF